MPTRVPRTRAPRIRASIAAIVALAALTACGPDQEAIDSLEADVAALRSELAQRRDAEATLEQRLDEVEAAVADATTDDGLGERLTEVDEELGRIVDALTVLEADLEAQAAAREQLAADAEAADLDLRNGLADLRGDLDTVRGSIGLLDDQVDVLRERIDSSGS